jgi:integrase/recombinase XerD
VFDQVMKSSNWVWIYKMGRFAEERRAFLCDLNEQGHSTQTLRNVNRFLLAIAERVNVRQSVQVSEVQIVRAAGSWAAKSRAPHSKAETREAAAKRFVYIAKNWLRFLGKWRDPERNPQFRNELDSFLKELRDERGYTNQTLSTRESALTLFFEWLGKQSIPLKEVSPQTLTAYFLENKTRGWKKATIKVYAQSLRVFFSLCRTAQLVRPRIGENNREPSHLFNERTSGKSRLGAGAKFDCEP